MKKKVKLMIGAVSALLVSVILILVSWCLIFTEIIVIDCMPASDIQEQIDIYAKLGYCMGGHANEEDIKVWLTHHQKQKWLQDVQKDIDLYLEETEGLDNMVFEISEDRREMVLIASEDMSFRTAATYLLAFIYNMQLYQLLNGEEDWKINFVLKDLPTEEVLYTVVLPDSNIRIE